jgi:purine-cytosine permease-like protein
VKVWLRIGDEWRSRFGFHKMQRIWRVTEQLLPFQGGISLLFSYIVSWCPLSMEFFLRFKQEDKYKISCGHFVGLHWGGVCIFFKGHFLNIH